MQLSELPKTRAEAKLLGLSMYYTAAPCKHGHDAARFSINTSCQECSRLRTSARYYKNPVAHAEKVKVWAAANKEKRKEIARNYARRNVDKQKTWGEANKEKILEIKRRWKLKNKEATNANTRNRRARLRGAEGTHNKADIDALYAKQNGICTCCPTSLLGGYHVDHIVAISKGGSNWPSNLQLLCASCNTSKSDKDFNEWLQQRVIAL